MMADDMISMDEYKKLQRKYDRRDRTAKEAEAKVVSLEAGLARVESLMEGLTQFIAGDDTALKSHADSMISENKSKRTSDQTAAQFQSWLNRELDDNDEDWDDPKFADVRKIVDEINSTGDMSRVRDAEDAMRRVLSPSSNGTDQERIDAAVQAAVAAQKNDSKRVDTGGGAVRNPGSVTRNDLRWNPSEGIGDLKARLDQAMDQLTK